MPVTEIRTEPSRPLAPPPRLAHIDALRVALTVGVIATHAVITYSAFGSWFYREGGLPPAVGTLVGVPVALGALCGMGLFFFIAGAFLPVSLRRKGLKRFLSDRLIRLGWPLLIFVLLIVPLVQTWVAATVGPSASPTAVWRTQAHLLDPGPLWFVWVLLLFSTVVAVLLQRAPETPPRRLRVRLLLVCAVGITFGTFVVRIWYPIDSYQVGAAHLWQWGQCIGLFLLGVIAGREGWLTSIPDRVRRACLLVAVVAAAVAVAALAAFHDNLDPLAGGWHWQSLIIAAIEGTLSVSVAIVLVDLFPRSEPGSARAVLPRSAYGAYLLQTPVLVGIALGLRPLNLSSGVKLLVLLPVAVILSFALALVLLRAPALRRVL
jgi:hypothetical protein